mmetsp:Transcript_22032/g.32425  ORF Transcript_22032/g.32425 Transcript_22032/m.32425 type:complete len:135 (+) Transcript_22032:54-458(+)
MTIHCDITAEHKIKSSLKRSRVNRGKKEESSTSMIATTTASSSPLSAVRPCINRRATVCCGEAPEVREVASSSCRTRRRASVTFGQVALRALMDHLYRSTGLTKPWHICPSLTRPRVKLAVSKAKTAIDLSKEE